MEPRLSDYPVGYYGVVLLHPPVWQTPLSIGFAVELWDQLPSRLLRLSKFLLSSSWLGSKAAG